MNEMSKVKIYPITKNKFLKQKWTYPNLLKD